MPENTPTRIDWEKEVEFHRRYGEVPIYNGGCFVGWRLMNENDCWHEKVLTEIREIKRLVTDLSNRA
jgi:hypothetical protein